MTEPRGPPAHWGSLCLHDHQVYLFFSHGMWTRLISSGGQSILHVLSTWIMLNKTQKARSTHAMLVENNGHYQDSQLLSSSDINEPYIYGVKLYEARTRVSRTSECQLISQLNWLFPHFVLCLLRHLQQTARVPFSEVAILTPYTAQGNAYRTSLTRLHLEDSSAGYNLVLIKTIDSFQGGEASVVLYDTTATDGPGHQKHCGRLNVAISRARAAMYVVANVGELNKATEVQRGTFSSMNHQASVANRLLLTHYPVTFFNWVYPECRSTCMADD
ncbi:hypothetical protein AnigIFM63309_008044 [Aspergillus niger]|nr:hypothetical protein AnigIFM63309_008044 [Aspergillus niger]